LNPRKFIFVALFFVSFGSFFAQQLRFRHISSEDGLSANYVSSIFQDSKGFIWFGTQDGLNKYDGYQIKIFKNDPTSIHSLSSSEITYVTQLADSLMLIGTREGLNSFNPVTETFTRMNSVSELGDKINIVTSFDKDNVLIGTTKGLIMLNLPTKVLKTLKFPVEGEVNVLCIRKSGDKTYIGTGGNGLWLFNNSEVVRVNLIKPALFKIELKELGVITDIEEYAGSLYLGTEGNGIFKVSGSDNEIMSKIVFSEDKNNDINFINNFEIRNSKIFVSTGYGFVVHNLLSGKSTKYFKSDTEREYGLSENKLNYLFIDDDQNIWIGTKLKGVSVCFSQTLRFPNTTGPNSEKFENIYSFCETEKGEKIIGGLKSLYVINTEKNEIMDLSKILGSSTALCIYPENDHVYWIGTWGIGLIRYDISTGKKTVLFNPQFGGTILCLKINDGNIYAGSVGDGLFKINLKTLEYKNFNEKDGLPNLSINTIFSDSKSNVWLGTYDGGLVKMKGFEKDGKLPIEKVYKNSGKQGQVASNIVFGVNEDKNGNIWVATSSGLSKLIANDAFHNFYEKDGLPNSYLYSILKDSINNFWMSSNNGIIRFNPLLPEKEIVFKSYGLKDGLINTEYNMGAAFASNSGNMYFGGAKGFNVFRPTSIKDNFHAPQAYLVSYKRGGNDVPTDSSIIYKKHLNLSWKENYFQFEIVALDYTDPSKNKFKYMLEGYDQTWSAPTNVRYVSYTELPGGEYTFKVKAANNDGIWNETPYAISITVVPPFWKTKLFYVFVFLFAGGTIYFYTQYRTNAIKKENKILENKVAERTRELAEKNRDITSSIEYAKRIQEAILPAKEQIFSKLQKVFILYKPKDIVSGDFYWFTEKNNWKIFAVVDCTGHGVPGAFMSMIGHNLLNQIIQEKGVTEPGEILNQLHKGVQEALRQGNNEISTNDGMDVSIIAISTNNGETRWAGANRPLVIIDTHGTFIKHDGNKFPVGGVQMDMNRLFTTHTIKTNTAAMCYMFSDGYADQFGGDKGKKFMVKRFHDILTNIHLTKAEEQKKELELQFEQWRQNHEQVDDVLVVGIAI